MFQETYTPHPLRAVRLQRFVDSMSEDQLKPHVKRWIFTDQLYQLDDSRKQYIKAMMREMEEKVERRLSAGEEVVHLKHPNRQVLVTEKSLCLLDDEWPPTQDPQQPQEIKGWLNDEVCGSELI